MSVGSSKSKSAANNQFSQNVWGPQGGALQSLYSGARGLFGQTGGQTGANQNQYGQNVSNQAIDNSLQGQQNQLSGGAYGGMPLQNQLTESINQSFSQPSAMQQVNAGIMGGAGNNYADVMRGQYVQDADLASQNVMRNLDARAAASGMSGGARQGVATRGAFEDINRNLQRNMAQTGFSSFEKDLDRKLGIAEQADQNTFGRQQLLSNMIGGQNQAIQSGMGFGENINQMGSGQQMMPWQQAGAYSNIIGGPTVLGQGSSVKNSASKGTGVSAGN